MPPYHTLIMAEEINFLFRHKGEGNNPGFGEWITLIRFMSCLLNRRVFPDLKVAFLHVDGWLGKKGNILACMTWVGIIPIHWDPFHSLESIPFIGILSIHWHPFHSLGSIPFIGVLPIHWGPSHSLATFPFIGVLPINWRPSDSLGWGPSDLLASFPFIGVHPIYWGASHWLASFRFIGVLPIHCHCSHSLGSFPFNGILPIHWSHQKWEDVYWLAEEVLIVSMTTDLEGEPYYTHISDGQNRGQAGEDCLRLDMRFKPGYSKFTAQAFSNWANRNLDLDSLFMYDLHCWWQCSLHLMWRNPGFNLINSH